MTGTLIPFPLPRRGISPQAIIELQQYAPLEVIPHSQVQRWGVEDIAANAFPLYSFSREPCYYAASLIDQIMKADPTHAADFTGDIPAAEIILLSHLGGVCLSQGLAATRFYALVEQGKVTQRNWRVSISELDLILKDYLYAAVGAQREYHEEHHAKIIPFHPTVPHDGTPQRNDAEEVHPRRQKRSSPERAALDEQIRDALPLVKKIAYQIARKLPSNVLSDDLISAGHEGLMGAAARYDGKRDFKAYAKSRIRGAMLDYLRQLDPLGKDTRKRVSKVAQLEQGLNGKATREEIIQRAGITVEQYDIVQQLRHVRTISLDNLAERETQVSDANPTPEEIYEARQRQEYLGEAISEIPENKKRMRQRSLRLHFFGGWTLKQIGEELGVAESRVSQIISKALPELQRILKAKGISA